MSRTSTASRRAVPALRSAKRRDGALRCAASTHTGLLRNHNEDRLHADPERGIFMVIDGIGGEAAGETAAETALELMRKRLERRTGNAEERIREAIAVANNEIVARARANPAWEGMGCVLTVAIVEDGHVTVGHVGDSRLYVLRGRGIAKITHDHSPVGEREDRGDLDERTAMHHPRRNEVYRSVGAEEHGPFDEDFVEIARFEIEPEHAMLLCTDGLTDLVTRDEMLQVVDERASDPEAVVEGLVGASLNAGGKDNVSVIFVAGPRFARAWRRGQGFGGDGAAPVFARPRLQMRSLLGRRGVRFALGAVSGALITFAVMMMGRGPAVRAPVGGTGEPGGARVLQVGPGKPFRAIADAIGAARPGDVVLVASGTYREQVRLEEGVSLVAAVPRKTILVPTTDGSAVVGIVAESMQSGRISGIAIRGTDATPLDIGIRLGDAAVSVEDVEVSGARLAGVLIEGRRSPGLLASWIHDNPGSGVIVRAGGAARLAHNLIEQNGRGAAGPGIDLEPGSRAELIQNVIARNAGPGVRGVPPGERRSVLGSNRFEAGGKSGPPTAPSPTGRPR